ncbi:hypothetical protein FNV43_RR15829 [Rhamnella rubrinervis]|uniref:Uncharacterized protein n=1 Tax=Rhamnella rubrinervis TaxID=2594499 RepID=A0A8K0E9M5_9ROSA|nr:hypothetical protein FNV43_RR15829 [Rhamnella rubrinervis]
MEHFQEKYFNEEPLPVPLSQLHVPSTKNEHDEDSPGGWYDYNEMDSDSDFEDFGPVNVTTTSTDFVFGGLFILKPTACFLLGVW